MNFENILLIKEEKKSHFETYSQMDLTYEHIHKYHVSFRS